MFRNVLRPCLSLLLLIMAFGGEAWGQFKYANLMEPIQPLSKTNLHDGYFTVGLRKYLNSFTSYEFLDPNNRQVDPLSRLEWPWEQAFGVVKAGANYKGLQVNFEGSSTLFTYSGLLAQDSDWGSPPYDPSQKDTFSDGLAMPRAWTIDASVGFDLPIISCVRWVIGYRAQQFRFTYTDSTQWSLIPNNSGYSPGESIQFTQNYKQYYGGGVVGVEIDLANVSSRLSETYLVLRLLGDVGYVTANNVDFHVLRLPAPRFTYESTHGISWRVNLATDFHVTNRLTLGLAGEFMRIRTGGSHRWTHPSGIDDEGNFVDAVDRTWDGCRVWSDQKFIEINAALNF